MIQGTPKWFAARASRITASRFGDVMARPDTKRYNNYLEEIIDNLSGIPVFSETKPWFEHGIDMEPRAIKEYEWHMFKNGEDIEVRPVGIIIHPKYDFISCSPDGECFKDGKYLRYGIEIKSRVSKEAHKKCKRIGMPGEHKPQVQGSLWISKEHKKYPADYWCFISYYENKNINDINVVKVEHDIEYHKRLEEACLMFWDKVQKG